METIFTLKDIENDAQKINLDELFEIKQQRNLKTLEIYKRILSRIHNKIKLTSRQKNGDQFTWFLVPEIIMGIPKYDHADCIGYLVAQLKENGFVIKYYHPNLMLISWQHYVPSYVRHELKKKTGFEVDQFGNQIIKEEDLPPRTNLFQNNNNLPMFENIKYENTNNPDKPIKQYRDINSYKPSGNLIYSSSILKEIENKLK
jgi:hypothetical protein